MKPTKRIRVVLLGAIILAFEAPVDALVPYRVADADPSSSTNGSEPFRFTRLGGRILFSTRTTDFALWSTDGSGAGTVRLLDSLISLEAVAQTTELFYAIACGGSLCQLVASDGTPAGTRALIPVGSSSTLASIAVGARRIYFSRYDIALGEELFTSDGTVAGTRRVRDLAPGPASSSPRGLAVVGNRVLFFALNALYVSDGTAAGTRRLKAVGTPRGGSTVVGGRLVFFATDAAGVVRLWASDGTAGGTVSLGVERAGSGLPVEPVLASTGGSGFAWLSSTDGEELELWATDGTAARTRRLKSFPFTSTLPSLSVAGARVAFVASDAEHGAEMWASDGTTAGTRLVRDVCPGPCDGVEFEPLFAHAGRIWFGGATASRTADLWISDLTPGGTRRVKVLNLRAFDLAFLSFVATGRGVYFRTTDLGDVDALWVSDGRAQGTVRLLKRRFEDEPFGVVLGAELGGRHVFGFDDGVHGMEPWSSDGTVAGTALLADLETSSVFGAPPRRLLPAGSRAFFFTGDDDAPDLWVSDGTDSGTVRVATLPDRFTFAIRGVDLGGRVAFFREQGFEFGELWASDGTPAGTARLDDGLEANGQMRAVQGKLFFEANDGVHGAEVYVSDGTPEGTLRLTDFSNFDPFPDFSEFERRGYRVLGDQVVFLAADEFGRFDPWISDGTIAGTRLLAEVDPALVVPFFELASEIVELGGRSYFVSGGGDSGSAPQLWVTDRTAAGTRVVLPVRDSAGRLAGSPGLVAASDKVYLFYNSGFEQGLWATDGTTSRVVPGSGFGLGGNPVAWGGRLAYAGDRGALVISDGTREGTDFFHLADGNTVGNPGALAVLDGKLVFTSYLGIAQTDGTPAGTTVLLPALSTSTVTDMIRAGDRIYFPWSDDQVGAALWALRP